MHVKRGAGGGELSGLVREMTQQLKKMRIIDSQQMREMFLTYDCDRSGFIELEVSSVAKEAVSFLKDCSVIFVIHKSDLTLRLVIIRCMSHTFCIGLAIRKSKFSLVSRCLWSL